MFGDVWDVADLSDSCSRASVSILVLVLLVNVVSRHRVHLVTQNEAPGVTRLKLILMVENVKNISSNQFLWRI